MSALPEDFDADAKYMLRRGPAFELVSEEITILKSLLDALILKVPADLAEEDSHALVVGLLRDDPELTTLVHRLEELSQSHDESVLWMLASNDEEPDDEPPQG